MKKLIACAIAALLVSNICVYKSYADINKSEDLKAVSELRASGREDSYDAYISKYAKENSPNKEITIEASTYVKSEPQAEILDNFKDNSGKSIKTGEEGFAEWEFNVDESGLYSVLLQYYPIEGRGTDIEREIWINDELPFYNAKHIILSRVWSDEKAITHDSRGNDKRPSQIEKPMWRDEYLTDYMRYVQEPYKFYFKKGKNTIKLVSVKEPAAIRKIVITKPEEIKPYNEIKDTYVSKGYKEAQGEINIIQGEEAVYKSDPTLYAINDRTSPATVPYSSSKLKLNTIGGNNWKTTGQTITWQVEAPESGLYKIGIKYRQNLVRGSFVNRKLLIDDKVPFKEVENIQFNYKNEWVMKELGDKEPYLFYLEKGKHAITLEVTLGDLAEILKTAEDSVYQLNVAYRRILMIMGSSPDQFRDYQLEKNVPDAIEILGQQAKVMQDLSDKLMQVTGQRGSQAAVIDKLLFQLNGLYEKPETIQKRWGDFKTNIGSLATWILTTSEQPLEIDYLVVSPKNKEMPSAKSGFFSNAVHEVRSLAASFTEDYSSIGNVESKGITVWIQSGRDQAQIIKQLVDDSFTPKTNIPVNIKLVQGGVLLPATVSGQGPDVALQVGAGEPVNFAMRNAAADLTQFKDLKEVTKRFHPSATVPYSFNGGVYALPETQTFPMLFYRADILDELELKVPNTWEELYNTLAVIQKNYMDVGITTSASTGLVYATGLNAYTMFLYQSGGSLYENEGVKSALDSEKSINAFKQWTSLYVNYKLPLEFEFSNRFRTGEMPIGIADYSLYNTLSVFAPEIRGLWNFAPIPGTVKEDGTIDRSASGTGLGCMMLENSKQKEAAWEFMKWWTEADTQKKFGREMESLLGVSARYSTANLEAMQSLPWSVKDYKNILQQWQWVKGNPEVAGGYFTSRHIENAFRKVINEGEEPRETLLDYVTVINNETENKRKEFKLDSK
jgi:ABC-type glycerol-3-phosphate transport system substrate-binding protein